MEKLIGYSFLEQKGGNIANMYIKFQIFYFLHLLLLKIH